MRNISFLLIILIFTFSCNSNSEQTNKKESGWKNINGTTMGTTYSVIYHHPDGKDFKRGIDSVLIDLNNSLSTYIPNSLISLINRRDSVMTIEVDDYFYTVFTRSKTIYTQTNGAFDPTVMPLVNFWGFGYDVDQLVDTSKIDSLLQLLKFNEFSISTVITPSKADSNIRDTSFIIEKRHPYVQLDFSAIAKGYGSDIIGKYLSANGIEDYFVEIGGEIATKGKYKEDKAWRVGVEKPVPGDVTQREIYAIIGLSGESIATSGNYRNFREVNGTSIAHTINPFTGYPEQTNLLSASIIAEDCMTADALATACMVLGVDKAFNLITSMDKIEGFFIYYDDAGNFKEKYTAGFEKFIVERPELTTKK